MVTNDCKYFLFLSFLILLWDPSNELNTNDKVQKCIQNFTNYIDLTSTNITNYASISQKTTTDLYKDFAAEVNDKLISAQNFLKSEKLKAMNLSYNTEDCDINGTKWQTMWTSFQKNGVNYVNTVTGEVIAKKEELEATIKYGICRTKELEVELKECGEDPACRYLILLSCHKEMIDFQALNLKDNFYLFLKETEFAVEENLTSLVENTELTLKNAFQDDLGCLFSDMKNDTTVIDECVETLNETVIATIEKVSTNGENFLRNMLDDIYVIYKLSTTKMLTTVRESQDILDADKENAIKIVEQDVECPFENFNDTSANFINFSNKLRNKTVSNVNLCNRAFQADVVSTQLLPQIIIEETNACLGKANCLTHVYTNCTLNRVILSMTMEQMQSNFQSSSFRFYKSFSDDLQEATTKEIANLDQITNSTQNCFYQNSKTYVANYVWKETYSTIKRFGLLIQSIKNATTESYDNVTSLYTNKNTIMISNETETARYLRSIYCTRNLLNIHQAKSTFTKVGKSLCERLKIELQSSKRHIEGNLKLYVNGLNFVKTKLDHCFSNDYECLTKSKNDLEQLRREITKNITECLDDFDEFLESVETRAINGVKELFKNSTTVIDKALNDIRDCRSDSGSNGLLSDSGFKILYVTTFIMSYKNMFCFK